MKINIVILALICVLCIFAGCKKDDASMLKDLHTIYQMHINELHRCASGIKDQGDGIMDKKESCVGMLESGYISSDGIKKFLATAKQFDHKLKNCIAHSNILLGQKTVSAQKPHNRNLNQTQKISWYIDAIVLKTKTLKEKCDEIHKRESNRQNTTLQQLTIKQLIKRWKKYSNFNCNLLMCGEATRSFISEIQKILTTHPSPDRIREIESKRQLRNATPPK